jgi:hypothetical protein
VAENHLYKKRKTQEIAHNAEETFAQQFFNFMRKNPQYVVQMPSSEINLDLGATVQQPIASTSASFAPNRHKDKYPVDEIKDPTPCTLMYVKGGTSRTIEVVEASIMPSYIHHVRLVPTEGAMVEMTTIREGHEFEDLDYPDEDKGIEKLVDAKGSFILWPRKDIIVKTHSSLIVFPQNTKAGGTPTSNMPNTAKICHPSVTPHTQNAEDLAQESQVLELQDNMEHRPPSPTRDLEPQESMGKRSLSPAKESQSLELQGNTEHTSPSPARF